MTPKPGPLHELVEPLQSFLQTFTQELTEQQFVPAFREELRRLVATVDNLQQSEETLQQIARGVDRLREVFAPAGTRLLEGVKDLEAVMRANAGDLRDRSGQVLNDLLSTHDQLEAALRNEAGLLQEQTSAGREALSRTVADVEGRLQKLTATIESLCHKMETEAAQLVSAPGTTDAHAAQVQMAAQAIPVTVHLPQELRDLLERTETTVQSELQRQRTELLIALKQNVTHGDERMQQLDRALEQAVSAVGPRLQEELDQALERMRDQLQAIPLTAPVTISTTDNAAPVSPEILHELAAARKAQKSEQLAAEKAIKDLAREYEAATHRQIAQVNENEQRLAESLGALHSFASALQQNERLSQEQLSALRQSIETLTTARHEQDQRQAREVQEVLTASQTQTQTLTQVAAAAGRAEQAATTATERAHAESRMLREKIDSALKDLAERMQRDTASETGRLQETLRQLAQAWQGELSALRDGISQVTTEASATLATNLQQLYAQISDGQRAEQSSGRDLHAELGRVATTLDDRVGNLQAATESFTEEMQSHVKAVANEVAKQRSNHEQSLAVLKEAIRANYDDNAARLKAVIEGGYDTFVKQIGTIPQALERYAHLIQSLHQGDQLALQAINSDTKNLLSLANEKFDLLVGDGAAIKKIYPLLDRRLEKHGLELDAVRKAQSKQDKELSEVKSGVLQSHEKSDRNAHVIRDEVRNLLTETELRFGTTQDALGHVSNELRALQEQDLPAFRREFATLLSTKFDLMESTVRERQEALRSEIAQRMEREHHERKRIYLLLGLLAVLAVTVQVSVYFLNQMPVLP